MLCQKCWSEEAKVHFTIVGPHDAHEHAYCLACARQEHLSWLLVWGYARSQHPCGHALVPEVLRVNAASRSDRGPSTLIATAVARCACGCYVATGTELPCGHGTHELVQAPLTIVEHVCHCGRALAIPTPIVFCPQCRAAQTNAIVATVETCLWDEERRRLVAVDYDMRGGRVTWGTFATMN
ncbi:MAG TPA: hypothetical protein VNE39_09460 [Planctomycetota bacterium]|nr:hypothetical protein [Planctomycetota bacterium]